MKKTLFTLALLAMIMVSCTQDNLEIEAQENRTFTVSAAMPEANDDAQTRVSLTPDAETGSYGLDLKWEEGDKLMLCFEKDGTYYHNDAPIVGSSISNNGKSAQFTITVPSEIPNNASFCLFGVYQKTDTRDDNGGYFKDGSMLYELENSEEQCITLDKMGSTGKGIARPMLYFSQANIVNSSTPAFVPFNLKHSGWMMALHFKNSSGVEMDMPEELKLDNPQGTKWAWNGYHGTNTRYFDVSTQAFSYKSSTIDRGRDLWFKINEYSWLPFTGQKLAAGESIVFYRWVASLVEVPQLEGILSPGGNQDFTTPTTIHAKTVTNGKMYHVYSEWDGTDYKFVAAY
ncbi:hypothetical protein KCV26_08925 [Petrimonas sulfuriphila]|uniref:hypothetical protein n=1 Tax=Petrimonas sulfuriphila TaxID=285070 RepID=UPI003252780A|nr:hypothetical protein [Bacteroidaceae bacterium]